MLIQFIKNLLYVFVNFVYILRCLYSQFSILTFKTSTKYIKPNYYLPENIRTFAYMVQMAYKSPNTRRKIINDYFLDERYNDHDIVVYKNYEELIIASRGTHKTSIPDLTSCLDIIAGDIKNSKKYKDMKQKVVQIIMENKNSLITLTAHSLGSSAFNDISKELQIPLISFNRGNCINAIDNPLNVDYIIKNDFISNSILIQRDNNINIFTKNPSTKNFHTIANFI